MLQGKETRRNKFMINIIKDQVEPCQLNFEQGFSEWKTNDTWQIPDNDHF